MKEPIKLPYREKLKRIVQFVISKGVASHSDIIRFAVDQNYGEGTYDSGNRLEKVYDFSMSCLLSKREKVLHMNRETLNKK